MWAGHVRYRVKTKPNTQISAKAAIAPKNATTTRRLPSRKPMPAPIISQPTIQPMSIGKPLFAMIAKAKPFVKEAAAIQSADVQASNRIRLN